MHWTPCHLTSHGAYRCASAGISNIVNLSLTPGVVLAQLKVVHVTPFLKKVSLYPEDLKNFRPVSNLHFPSKVVEKAIAVQLSKHLEENALHDPCQSVYRASHSTEMALFHIQSDVLLALDRKEAVFLVLLDLSSAFDLIDHAVLLEALETHFGINGQALSWFRSHLTACFQAIHIDGSFSHKQSWIVASHKDLCVGASAVYTLFLPSHWHSTPTQPGCASVCGWLPTLSGLQDSWHHSDCWQCIENCVEEIWSWMVAHKVMINQEKIIII